MSFKNAAFFLKYLLLYISILMNAYAVEMKSGVDEKGITHVRVWGLAQGPGNTSSERAEWRVLKAFEKQYFNEILPNPDHSVFNTFSDCFLNLRCRGR